MLSLCSSSIDWICCLLHAVQVCLSQKDFIKLIFQESFKMCNWCQEYIVWGCTESFTWEKWFFYRHLGFAPSWCILLKFWNFYMFINLIILIFISLSKLTFQGECSVARCYSPSSSPGWSWYFYSRHTFSFIMTVPFICFSCNVRWWKKRLLNFLIFTDMKSW